MHYEEKVQWDSIVTIIVVVVVVSKRQLNVKYRSYMKTMHIKNKNEQLIIHVFFLTE